MAGIAPEKSNLFVRCNYDVGKPGEGAQGRQDQAIKGAAKSLLALVEQAIVRIEQGDRGEAALRELWASLVEIKALRARDPGIRMAAQDVYEAAAAAGSGYPHRGSCGGYQALAVAQGSALALATKARRLSRPPLPVNTWATSLSERKDCAAARRRAPRVDVAKCGKCDPKVLAKVLG